MTFRYAVGITTIGSFTNVTSNRTTLLPRFQRNNLQSNLYNYRSEVITPYISGIQDGVYHIYTLSADKAVPTEFTDIKYSQNVVDLYPQLDRDNINDNPPSAKSFAKRDPLGEVVTNDLKKSITKESTDTLLTSFGIGLDVSNVSGASNETITFAREHGLAGIVTHSGALNNGTNSTGYAPEGIYQNLKLLNTDGGTWQGATARVVVEGGGNVASADIVSSGSGYSAGTLFFDSSVFTNTGNGTARFNIATSGITTAIGNVVQFTGAGTTSDTYHRITAVSGDRTISIAKTSGDPTIIDSQYAFVVGPSVQITTTSYSSGVRTFNCSGPHGLVAGNRFRVTDSSNNNHGDYIVKDRVDFDTFTALTPSISVNGGYILKHGLSANNASSDSTAENLAIRSVPLFDKETLVADSAITATTSTIIVSNTYVAITKRFPLGSYIQIDEEIMRVASSTLSTPPGSTLGISVIRGALATRQVSHDSGSLIRKIKPISIEFRRPSIVRASGHTFEYLGYGPGNYSTGLPQVQSITLTEREEFLVQSQERSGGIVVYTGMNNNGDSFVGNRKTSSSTGEEVTFDNPIPTITGEDPSRLSAVFDEVTVKERLVVEGGNSGTVLSQFDGPVTFNKEVKFTDAVNVRSQLKVSNQQDSTTSANGALIVSGGVGIAKTLNVGGTTTLTGLLNANGGASITTLEVSNATTLTGLLNANGGIAVDTDKFIVAGDNTGNTTIAGTTTIAGLLNANGGIAVDTDKFIVAGDNTGDVSIGGTLGVTGATTLTGLLTVNANINAGANTITAANFTGQASDASTIRTVSTSTNANHFITFVDSDNATAANESLYTDAGIYYNPDTNGLFLTGDITAFASDERLKTNIEPL